MKDDFNFEEIEKKWQKTWAEEGVFEVVEDPSREKYYLLEMYPYPSGRIHMGHVRNYSIGDVIARFKAMQGLNVIHPIGWDALGMPAENAAIKHGIHPRKWTLDNVAYMREQLKKMGFGYAWSREVNSCLPDYYKWNQWIFLKMFERGLAYRKDSWVNWCSQCRTVLANEQVVGGGCWRCETPVVQKKMEQWFLKITDYAEELLSGHEALGKWPEHVLLMQKNWIGKSTGAHVGFAVPALGRVHRGLHDADRHDLRGHVPRPFARAPDGPRPGRVLAPARRRTRPGSPRPRPPPGRGGRSATTRRKASTRARKPSIRSRASSSRSGSRTTSSWTTGREPSWPFRPTTSATTISRRSTGFPSGPSSSPEGPGTRSPRRGRPMSISASSPTPVRSTACPARRPWTGWAPTPRKRASAAGARPTVSATGASPARGTGERPSPSSIARNAASSASPTRTCPSRSPSTSPSPAPRARPSSAPRASSTRPARNAAARPGARPTRWTRSWIRPGISSGTRRRARSRSRSGPRPRSTGSRSTSTSAASSTPSSTSSTPGSSPRSSGTSA